MNEFTPGQRWISYTEPELGLGLILHVDNSRVAVLFPASDEKRLYARDNAPLTRVSFIPGETIRSIDSQVLTINELKLDEGLITYRGVDGAGNDFLLKETELNHHTQFNKPQERFFTGQIDPGKWFQLRYQAWRHLQKIQQLTVRGMIGGRTSLLAHQLYIVHQTALRHTPRVMLADEVGLGKTIEAGLILHHRLINGLSSRALIIVPEALQNQWLVEMIRRFNLRFSLFDEERCVESHSDNPFLSAQLVLCSQSFFTDHPERQSQALQAEWDLVIIDEAHHLEWSPTSASPEYQFADQLSRVSPGLILLTATPEQMGKESHFSRLRLLDPDRYFNYEVFNREQENFAPVAKAASLLLDNQPLDQALQETLRNLPGKEDIEDLLDNIDDPEKSVRSRTALINVLLDCHGTGRILFRNSRQTVKGFPDRKRYGYTLEKTAIDQNATEKEPDKRLLWLINLIREKSPEKILLICTHAQTVLDLESRLKKVAGIQAAKFHEKMTIIERDRSAAWFADKESDARILLCSEIGSEGRNFQFVHHLVLYDLPQHPDLLQQRIGRLDRIGQTDRIRIHIPYQLNSAEQILFRWYDEGLNAFRENSHTAPQVYELQKKDLHRILAGNLQDEVHELISHTQRLDKILNAQFYAGRDQLLELNSCRKEVADQLVSQIEALEHAQTLWPFMDQVFDCYGVEVEYHSADCYILRPGNHLRIEAFPELPVDGMTVTINREIALSREDIQFLSWEHPLVSAAMDLFLCSETGNAAISIVECPKLDGGQYLLEALFIIECSAPAYLQIQRFLPPVPIRILVNQNGNDLTGQLSHENLIETEQTIDVSMLEGFLKDQRQCIINMLEHAETRARMVMDAVMEHSGDALFKDLEEEIDRLERLIKVNPSIKREEILLLKQQQNDGGEMIKASNLKLDAIQLVIVS